MVLCLVAEHPDGPFKSMVHHPEKPVTTDSCSYQYSGVRMGEFGGFAG